MKPSISCLIFCCLSFHLFAQPNWEALGGPRGLNIDKLKTGPDESIFILSSDFPNRMYRSLNGGINWEELVLPEGFSADDWAVGTDGSVYLKDVNQVLRIALDETEYTTLPILPAVGISIDVADDGTLLFTGNSSIYYLPPEATSWVNFIHDEGDLNNTKIIAGTGDIHYLRSSDFVNSKIYRLNLATNGFDLMFDINSSFPNVAYHPVSGLWVLDGDSKLYNSTDQGENWQEVPTPLGAQFINIYFGADERIFLSYSLTSFLHYTSTDNGQTWTTSLDLMKETVYGPSVAVLSDGSELYYHAPHNHMLLKSTDQGLTFEDLLLNLHHPRLEQLTDAGTDRLLANTGNLDMQWSIDDGQSWTKLRTNDDPPIPLEVTVRALDGNLVAIGNNEQIYRSLDAGDTWENITPSTGISGMLYEESIAALDQDRILVVNDNGTSYYTSNGGTDWLIDETSQIANNLIAHPSGVFINYSFNSSTSYLVYHTSNNTWETQNFEDIQATGRFQVVVMTDERVVIFFPGDSLTVGWLYISEDLGETFTTSHQVPELAPFSSTHLKVNKANELFLLNDETIYKSSTDGENWIIFDDNLPGGGRQNGFFFIDEKDYLYYQADNDLLYRTEEPTGFLNFISGHLWSDNNQDCILQEEGEFDLSGWIVKASGENGTYYSHTNTNGDYLLNAPLGDYELEAVINNPLYAPCTAPTPVSMIVGDTVEMIDFPLQPTTFCSLLRPLVSTPFLRRCFNNTFSISVGNEGNIAAENALIIVQLDDFLAFENADLPVFSQEGQDYIFDLGTILPGELIEFSLTAYLSCDAELGQEHCVTLNTEPGNDCAPDYVPDSYEECQANIGSFDPNDKRAFVNGREATEYLLPGTERLTYHIRFQNTGTDTAFTVVVEDVLPMAMDASSFRLEGASHPVRVDFPYNSATATTVHFIFDNILLVDSFTNEPASHGFVKFSMAPNADIELGTVVNNYADIFFDFNESIRTNTSNLVYDFSSSINNIAQPEWQVEAYPNPFTNSIQLKMSNIPSQKVYCDWFNAQGQLVDQQIMRNGQLNWERPDLPVGLYSYSLYSDNHFLASGKVIKQNK